MLRGEGRGGPGCREACRVVGQPWEETERGHQGNTMGECFERTQHVGFLLDETF